MKHTPEYHAIDSKFVLAVDEIIACNKELGVKPNNDNSIGKIIYPSNRGIISSVRSKSKHIPHLAVINLSKHFNVDMNYFYSENAPLKYNPPVIKNVVVKGDSINSHGNNSIINHATKDGKIFGVNTAENKSANTIVETIEVNTMINHFISKINDEQVAQFLKIISKLQNDNKATIRRFEKLLDERSKELILSRKSYVADSLKTREELSETRGLLHESQQREIELLRGFLTSKKN